MATVRKRDSSQRTATILGYEVTTHEDANPARLCTLIRALKRLHAQHRLPHAVTITLPPWRPELARLDERPDSASTPEPDPEAA